MTVVFKGGTSGMSKDYLAPTPDSGSPQPVLTTETSGPIPGNIHFMGGTSGNREDALPTMPTGGTIPESGTDMEDPAA